MKLSKKQPKENEVEISCPLSDLPDRSALIRARSKGNPIELCRGEQPPRVLGNAEHRAVCRQQASNPDLPDLPVLQLMQNRASDDNNCNVFEVSSELCPAEKRTKKKL